MTLEEALVEIERLKAVNKRLEASQEAYVDAAVDIYDHFMTVERFGVVMQPDGDAARLAQDTVAWAKAIHKELFLYRIGTKRPEND